MFRTVFLLASILLVRNESARILAVFPMPLINHQNAHRSIINELVNRNHEIVLITPFPEYRRGKSPDNLMEIDVSNVTQEVWKQRYIDNVPSKDRFSSSVLKHVLQVGAKIVEEQFKIPEIKSFINNNETFDLLLLETWIRPTLFWTYIYDAPIISVSSFGAEFGDYINLGGPAHPLLYPTSFQHEFQNLNAWQKIVVLYEYWKMYSMYSSLEAEENELAKSLFGEVPSLGAQVKKIELMLRNIHQIWNGVRPVPMNVVHLGATQQDRERKTEMTEELKQYLDSCTNGVVYVSFDTNIHPWMIPEKTQRILIKAFSKLACPVLWKWDEEIRELPSNVKIGKWFPETELLEHPNVRLFISQCGQQSTDEAIAAAVPVLALPVAADEWRNAEKLKRHNLGDVLDFEVIQGDEFLKNVIENTMKNGSYRTNMLRMRKLLFDAPAPAPVRAANVIEYVLRHTAGHIASPTLHISWFQYMEIELFVTVIIYVCVSMFVLYKSLCWAFKRMLRRFKVWRDSKSYDYKSKA